MSQNKPHKAANFILLIIVLVWLPFLPNYAKAPQLHERLLVQGIGVDMEQGAFVVTLQSYHALNTGGGADVPTEADVISGVGNSVQDAFSQLSRSTGRQLMYSQNLILLIGEKAAQEGITEFFDFFIRHYETRPSVSVAVVRDGTAYAAMRCKKDDTLITAQEIAQLATSDSLNAASASSTVLQMTSDLTSSTASPFAAALRILEKGEDNELQTDGTALFLGDKLAGYLSADQSTGLLLMRGEAAEGTQVAQVEEIGRVSYSLTGCKSDITVTQEDGQPHFQIDVSVTANLYELDGVPGEQLPKDSFDRFRTTLEHQLDALCNQTLSACVTEYHCDPLNLGRHLRNQQTELYHKALDAWPQILSNSSYQVTVSARVEQIGQETNPHVKT